LKSCMNVIVPSQSTHKTNDSGSAVIVIPSSIVVLCPLSVCADIGMAKTVNSKPMNIRVDVKRLNIIESPRDDEPDRHRYENLAVVVLTLELYPKKTQPWLY